MDDDDDNGLGDGDDGADDPGFDPNDIEIDDPEETAGDGGGGDDGGGDDGGGDDDGGDGGDDGDGDDELAAAPVALPDVDEDVYGSRDAFANADDDDFEDDAGDWTAGDYEESAQNLFGEHEFFGDTAHQRYLDEGFVAIDTTHPIVQDVRREVPEAATIDFYERDGAIVPRGFLSAAALAALEVAFPQLVLDLVHVTVDRHPLDGEADRTPRELPDELRAITPADSVDLRKYATPVADQGATSRCAAFAWTHALELLGNIRNQPFPPLACSYTMLTFQERQGDARDFAWAWKGGDGTAGTWEPGRHLFVNGTCRHELWPNDDREPRASIEAMRDDARAYTLDAEVYNVAIDDVKKLLSAGLPVQISMATGDAFQDIGRDGVMRVAEAPKGQHGYHAMLCVGYVGNYFIVKNSWGTEWGDGGYCYIPKAVLADSEPEAVAIVPKQLGGTRG